MKNLNFLSFFLTFFFLFIATSFAQKPQIQLANLYHKNIDVQNYFVSEKLDGVRAYWDGEKLISREGNVFKAPKWFISTFPKEHLEGELWIARGRFEEVSGIVRKEIPIDQEWKLVRFMLFDAPKDIGKFENRLHDIRMLVAKSGSKYLKAIPQEEISSHKELMKKLAEVTKNGGEGLMLHRKDSFYKAERNDDLLKLKTYEDEEAIVIEHIPGSGKFAGMMGALLVENQDKIRFRIGSGFSEVQRKNPPKIGTKITYKFFGKTKNNKPRFPIFMRVR
jgi:DNA ligase-1